MSDTKQTTSDLDPVLVSQQWAATAEALSEALERWRAVSADTDGPLAEMHDDAVRNAAHWLHIANGLNQSEARRAVDAEFGPSVLSPFINYDPDAEQDEA